MNVNLLPTITHIASNKKVGRFYIKSVGKIACVLPIKRDEINKRKNSNVAEKGSMCYGSLLILVTRQIII